MELRTLPYDLSVCKVRTLADINLEGRFFFVGKTDEELSLVCETADAPTEALEREDGWRGLRVQGVLDFSLIGILSKITAILAENGVGIFAVSTYNTDYILTKAEDFDKALDSLAAAGYEIADEGNGH